jgi:SAM-dependent methyltransferase
MGPRQHDGSAGDADYGAIGYEYSRYRQADPHIAAAIHAALGDAVSVLNVGAGAGSYEPTDKDVVAVEPSSSMRAQRPKHLTTAIDAVAENLPFPDRQFDASMATYSVHQWSDLKAGLREMRRVTRGPIVIMTCDPREVATFWLNDYAPLVLATEARRYPAIDSITGILGGTSDVRVVSIPLDCRDGFNEAYYGRPEALLDEGARRSCSAWSFVEDSVKQSYVESLHRALASGVWDQAYGDLRREPFYRGSLRLIVSEF